MNSDAARKGNEDRGEQVIQIYRISPGESNSPVKRNFTGWQLAISEHSHSVLLKMEGGQPITHIPPEVQERSWAI